MSDTPEETEECEEVEETKPPHFVLEVDDMTITVTADIAEAT